MHEGIWCIIFLLLGSLHINFNLLALWVEWSKSQAQKERWLEEVLIVQEEMR
ncbi:hypothetical protein BS47DRAFT_1289483 [Hydnum rufescens UP504]|uniref:Uncharacterized protein n=1 Tax=Hydnum rufescens UP504 TaxID=1448309 RepID=A0A9P6E0V2_9AGAM|nr:hypothetical protein BS47DRAFT_1289483 [Hydnum rufescens UP504]